MPSNYDEIDEDVPTGKRGFVDPMHYADREPNPRAGIKFYTASACGVTIAPEKVETRKASKVTCGHCVSQLISEGKLRR